MGSGILKTLSSNKVPYDKLLYFFSHTSHSSKPCIGLLLGCLSACHEHLVVFNDAPVIYYRFASLASLVSHVLGAVATKMSFFVTGIALNFAEVSHPPLSLCKSSLRCVSSLGINPPCIVQGSISSLPAIRPRVLPADVSIALGLVSCPLGAHLLLFCLGVVFPQCTCSLAFMWM